MANRQSVWFCRHALAHRRAARSTVTRKNLCQPNRRKEAPLFIGHFAAALIAKKVAPSTSLGVLLAAAFWLDLVWPALLLAGVEHAELAPSHDAVIALRFTYYPFSHSVLAVIAWAAAGGAFWWWRARSPRAALAVAALVISHWLLDVVVHIPDLPLAFSAGPYFGIGLWQWPLAALSLELAMFVLSTLVYLHVTASAGARPRRAFYGLAAFVFAIAVANAVGPPPPGIAAVAWGGMATWLLVAWGWWADRQPTRHGAR